MAAEAPLPPLLPTPPRSEMLPILPTPPKSMMLPLLPTPHGLVLTMLASAMPGRADFFQRWDWNKHKCEKPCSSSVCSSSSSSDGSGSTDRADSVDRWDSHKKYKKHRATMTMASSSSRSSSSSHSSAGSPGRADSVERWDSKKLETSCSASTPTDRGRPDGNNNKRLPSPSRASSAERWDLHKKPRPRLEQTEKLPQANAAATTLATTLQKAAFAGPSFYASPEPSMLPMPPFFLLPRSRALCT